MKKLIDLYKLHINPEVDGLELYQFFKQFNLGGIIVRNPDPELDKLEQLQITQREYTAENWIYKNSKI